MSSPETLPPPPPPPKLIPARAPGGTLEAHPIALAFPMMDSETFQNLVKSLAENGFDQSKPIVLFEGKILDGRNRTKAVDVNNKGLAPDKRLAPSYASFTGTFREAVEFSTLSNLYRRHLDSGQRAMVTLKLMRLMPKPQAKPTNPFAAQDAMQITMADAARISHVSEKSIYNAKLVLDSDAKLAEEVAEGKTTLNSAHRQVVAHARATGREPPPPNAKEKEHPPAPPPPPTVDDEGHPIHPRAFEALTKVRGQAKELSRQLVAFKGALKAYCQGPGGRTIQFESMCLDIDSLARNLKMCSPYSSCPMNEECDEGCKSCQGTQWVTKIQYETLPERLRKRATPPEQ